MISGPPQDHDVEIAAALEGYFDFENPDCQLEDNFFELAEGCDDSDEDDDSESDQARSRPSYREKHGDSGWYFFLRTNTVTISFCCQNQKQDFSAYNKIIQKQNVYSLIKY